MKEVKTLSMGSVERSRSSILVVEPDATDRGHMRRCLQTLGFGGMSDVPSHASAMDKMEQRNFTHIIFDARPTNMPVSEFVKKVLNVSPEIIMIPASAQPDVDEVFELLILGARGYLVKPFTTDSLDDSVVNATKGEPISEVVLNAKDRNEALVAILMQSLDIATMTIKQASQFETAKYDIPRVVKNLYRSSDLAKTFAKGGPEGLIEAMEKFCIERSKGPATQLGRLRQRLHKRIAQSS